MSRDNEGDHRVVRMEAENELEVERPGQEVPIDDVAPQVHVGGEAHDLGIPMAAFPMFWAEPIRLAQPSYRDNDVMDHFAALEVRRMWRDPPAERAQDNNAWMDVYRPPVPIDPNRDAAQIFADAANGGVVPLEHLMNMGEIELGEFHEFESDDESSGIGTDEEQEPDDEEHFQQPIVTLANFIQYNYKLWE